MPVIKFIILIVIELPSFVACRRYGFSRQSKAEKVRKAWLMGENVWETQVLLPFASVPRGQAPSRGGTAGPWSLGNNGVVPAAFGPWLSLVASPVCCPCRLRSWGNTSSWDWKWRAIGSHDTRVKQTASNNSKTVEMKSTPRALSTPHLMREALHRCQQADGGERELALY